MAQAKVKDCAGFEQETIKQAKVKRSEGNRHTRTSHLQVSRSRYTSTDLECWDLSPAGEHRPGPVTCRCSRTWTSHLVSADGEVGMTELHLGTVESVFFVQNFVWKNYPLLLVESTSNFAWPLFWRNFSSRVIYFCQFFSASKIFLKLLLIWPGLDVFPFKMMKKEACHRVQHVKISRNWS